MTKTVEEWVVDEASAGDQDLSARRLFICFSGLAYKSYQYGASRVKGNEAETLLERPNDEIVVVDCMSLAGALAELINNHLEDENASVASQMYPEGFATKAASRCFDNRIVGNIRKAGENWAATSRCVFSSHYFVETGSQTRMFFDPCMFTTYSTLAEVMDWKFIDGGGPFYHVIKQVVGDPTTLLVRVPANNAAPDPAGFTGGWIRFRMNELTKNEQKTLSGRVLSPWDGDKYTTKARAAMTKINRLLSEKAGINAGHPLP